MGSVSFKQHKTFYLLYVLETGLDKILPFSSYKTYFLHCLQFCRQLFNISATKFFRAF